MMSAVLVVVAGAAAIAVISLARTRASNRRAAARWAAASRISVILAEVLDADAALENVARLLVPEFADWCALHVAEDQRVRRAVVVHVDPEIERWMRTRFIASPFIEEAPHGPPKVIRTGEADVVPDVGSEILDTMTAAPELLKRSGVKSWVIVPLRARQQTVGALTLAYRRSRGYQDDDVAWAQDLGHRIGLALENLRLYADARELFEQTVSANYVSTAEGRVLACNEMFARLLGFGSIDEVRSTDADSLYEGADERRRFIEELTAHRRLVGRETTFKRRDGQLVHTLVNAVGTFNDRGELVKITGFIVDRSAQKGLEEQLRQAQRLEAVGQLAGGVAHDFNNLLTIIIGCADLMRSAEPVASAGDHHPLDELTKAAKRAATLTQQLLAFSRRQVLQPRVIDLNESLRAIHAMLRRLVREKTVIMLELDPRIDPVRVDPGQLDQVIVNLVVNSVDAMPDGGTVVLKTENTTLTEADVARRPFVTPGRYVSLAIRDTGVGMDESTVARAFEPFFTTKAVGKGTGLGLSTVYGIVKQSGGYVWVESAPGAGTTVTICLPAAQEPVAAAR